MKATLLKSEKKISRFGGNFWYLFLKGEDGKSYRSCVYEKFGNFQRWKSFISRSNIILDNLNTKGKIIDADSFVREVK